MTQQPFYPPQYPQQPAPQPQQQYVPPPQAYAQPGFPPQQFAPQPYAAPAPQGPPAQALANGSLDEFYSQPNTGGGPGVSWKGKPDGYTFQGFVPRDVTNADVTQEVGAPNTQEAGRPQFYRDGRPKFVMAVPLQVQQDQEFPEGEARLFVRGQLRDELSRAMAEAGVEGAPKAGAVITVTLVQRKQGRGSIPQNVFRVVYTPPGGQATVAQAAQPQQAPAQQYAQPVQQQPQYGQPVPQQYAPQAQQGTGAPSPAPVPQQAPAQQYAQQPAQQGQVAQTPQAPPQQGLAMPSDFNAEQQALMARITGGQG